MGRRRRKKEEHKNRERWLVSYADFITLLFAFFTILYATSEQDKGKQQQFEKSIQKHIFTFGGIGRLGKQQVNENEKNSSAIEAPLKKFSKGNHASEKLLGKIETYVVDSLTSEQIEKHISEMETDTLGVRLTLFSDNLFESGSDKLKRSSLKLLNSLGEMIKRNKRRVWIEGHMDGPSGDKEAWRVSSLRANALARYLLKVHKLEPEFVASVAFGGERPLFPNTSEENRSRNRRTSLLILSQDAPF